MAEPNEIPLSGGFSNEVVRVGRTVRRRCGPWTPAVHAFLQHLQTVGFRYAPRVLGIDEQGREVLSFIDGKTAWWPWPDVLWTDEGLRKVAHMVRDLERAAGTFTAPQDAVWNSGQSVDDTHRVRHGDLAPWNTVWENEHLVALIDWDTAEPAPEGWDTAQAAWYFIPLRPPGGYQTEGFPKEDMQRHRLRVWCAASGTSPTDLLTTLQDVQRYERDRIADRGAAGIEPYVRFLARGDVAAIDAERTWLAAKTRQLLQP